MLFVVLQVFCDLPPTRPPDHGTTRSDDDCFHLVDSQYTAGSYRRSHDRRVDRHFIKAHCWVPKNTFCLFKIEIFSSSDWQGPTQFHFLYTTFTAPNWWNSHYFSSVDYPSAPIRRLHLPLPPTGDATNMSSAIWLMSYLHCPSLKFSIGCARLGI